MATKMMKNGLRALCAAISLTCASAAPAAIKMLQGTLAIAGEYQVRIAEADTDFDCIRDDPRFQKIIAEAKIRLGISEPVPAT